MSKDAVLVTIYIYGRYDLGPVLPPKSHLSRRQLILINEANTLLTRILNGILVQTTGTFWGRAHSQRRRSRHTHTRFDWNFRRRASIRKVEK